MIEINFLFDGFCSSLSHFAMVLASNPALLANCSCDNPSAERAALTHWPKDRVGS